MFNEQEYQRFLARTGRIEIAPDQPNSVQFQLASADRHEQKQRPVSALLQRNDAIYQLDQHNKFLEEHNRKQLELEVA